jgi:hypothetical protein
VDPEDYCDQCASDDCPGHTECPDCQDDLCPDCGGCACPETYCPIYPQCAN